jgi:hypothetical protein
MNPSLMEQFLGPSAQFFRFNSNDINVVVTPIEKKTCLLTKRNLIATTATTAAFIDSASSINTPKSPIFKNNSSFSPTLSSTDLCGGTMENKTCFKLNKSKSFSLNGTKYKKSIACKKINNILYNTNSLNNSTNKIEKNVNNKINKSNDANESDSSTTSLNPTKDKSSPDCIVLFNTNNNKNLFEEIHNDIENSKCFFLEKFFLFFLTSKIKFNLKTLFKDIEMSRSFYGVNFLLT